MLAQLAVHASAQEPAPHGAKPAAKAKADGGGGYGDIVGHIKETPGCLGVETAMTSSGKQVIFAWFKNREAVLEWYYSDFHQQLMSQLGDSSQFSDPLDGVAEGEGPLMAVAAITPRRAPKKRAGANGAEAAKSQMPVAQISVEVFRPVTKAKSFGGTFSPVAALLPGSEAYELENDEKKAEPVEAAAE